MEVALVFSLIGRRLTRLTRSVQSNTAVLQVRTPWMRDLVHSVTNNRLAMQLLLSVSDTVIIMQLRPRHGVVETCTCSLEP